MSNLKELVEKNQELVDLILKLEKENNELKNSLESKENKEKVEVKENLQEQVIGKRVEDEKYFYIEYSKSVELCENGFTHTDNDLYNSFNYFKNEEEAKKHAKHELLSLKLTRLRDELNDNWIPDWNNNLEEKHFISFYKNGMTYETYFYNKSSNLYFKSVAIRDEFKKLIPEEEILEYLNF